MSESNPDLFDQENRALAAIRVVHADEACNAMAYRNALGELIIHYERLMREMRRLIRRSDREEFEMNRLNERLNDLADELQYRANHDPLTGVFNRAAVIEAANHLLRTESLALVVLDIDHFKQINDSFGHPVGDAVICGVVNSLRRVLPDHAQVGRVGGEEFTVLLPRSDSDQARILAEKMRAAIENNDFALPGGRIVTASFGVSWTRVGAGFDLAYGRADEALYEAKRNGRNRVCVSMSSVDGVLCEPAT